MPRNLEDGLLRAAVDVERGERVMQLEHCGHHERGVGDRAEMLRVLHERVEAGAERSEVNADVVVLLEEAEVNARLDDAVVCLDGDLGDCLPLLRSRWRQ